MDVQVCRVAQGVHSGISAAGDSKPDGLDRVQPLGGLLQGQGAGRQSQRRPEPMEQ